MKSFFFLFAVIVLPIAFGLALALLIGKKFGPRVEAWNERRLKKSRPKIYPMRPGVYQETDPDEDFGYALGSLPPCLEPYRPLIDRVLERCVYLRAKPNEKVSATGSRLCGRPALPAGTDWPTDRGGEPMEFVGQLNMSELRGALAGDALADRLPAQGLLMLFIGDDHFSIGDDKAEEWRVVWRPELSGPIDLTQPPAEDCDQPACQLTLHRGRSLPSLMDEVVRVKDELGDDETVREEWHELGVNAASGPLHQVLGYSQPIQYDPRMDLIESQGKNRKAFDPSRWVLLWQIDSEDATGQMWGDAGMLYVLIRAEDLAAGRLDRARPVMQCG